MLYYKVLNKDGSFIGAISLNEFRFYNEKKDRMYPTTSFSTAQYVVFNNQYYKGAWLKEDNLNKNKYPEVDLILIEKEEYEKYMKQEI